MGTWGDTVWVFDQSFKEAVDAAWKETACPEGSFPGDIQACIGPGLGDIFWVG